MPLGAAITRPPTQTNMTINSILEIPNARIKSVQHKFNKGTLESMLKVEGVLTPELAADLCCATVVFTGTEARDGFSSVKLEAACESFKAQLAPYKMEQHSIDVMGPGVDSFVVTRGEDDGLLWIEARLHYSGDPYSALGYLLKVGDAPALLTITPLQQDLMKQPALPAEHQSCSPIPADASLPEWRTADEIRDGVPHHIGPDDTPKQKTSKKKVN